MDNLWTMAQSNTPISLEQNSVLDIGATSANVTLAQAAIGGTLTTDPGAGQTFTLPAAASLSSSGFTISNLSAANAVDIATSAGETINGAASPFALAAATTATFFSDGTNYLLR